VLEQQIDERLATATPASSEQQIGMSLAQDRVDEAARAA
jgi:hypothetical protein